MTNVVSFVKKNIKGSHYCYKMELDDLDNKSTKFNIKWFSLLYFMKFIDLFKEDICKTSSWILAKVIWLSITLDLQMEDCKSKNI
jgi:hypothetical protein